MIEYIILDDRYNTIKKGKTSEKEIEKAIHDKNIIKDCEYLNEITKKQAYWYINKISKYTLIFER